MYIDNIIDGILKGIGKQFGSMTINICDLVITILIIFFVVPKLSITGYVLSIFISEIFNFFASFILLKKNINFKCDFLSFCIKPFMSSLFAFLVVRLFSISFDNFYISSIFRIAFFAIVYVLVVFLGTGLKNIIKA